MEEVVDIIEDIEIPKPKIYCGLEEDLPEGYDRMGNRYECMRKGFGAGVYLVPDHKREKMLKKKHPPAKLSDEELEDIAFRLGIRVKGKTRYTIVMAILSKLTELENE